MYKKKNADTIAVKKYKLNEAMAKSLCEHVVSTDAYGLLPSKYTFLKRA